MAKRKIPTIQIYDDSYYKVGHFDQTVCCDCGMVHDLKFKFENGVILQREKPNPRATGVERRRRGIADLMQKVMDAQKPKDPA